MRVFVAGATGVLGASAVRALVASGHKVSGIGRSGPKREALAAAGASAVQADLFDPASLRQAVAGHDVVVNLATRIPPPLKATRSGAWRENDRIRELASRNLAEAAAAEGVLRLIQEAISFVYEDGGAGWITEAQAVRPNAFSASSITATDNAMGFADAYRFAVALRFGLLYGAANRDPEQFPEPDRFDVGRTPNRHLAFGGGAHFCLGNHLARLDMDIIFTTLFKTFRTIELVETPQYKRSLSVRGPQALRLKLQAA